MKDFINHVPNPMVIFWLYLSALCCLTCWDKQDVDLLRPEIPRYILSGYTTDIDDSTQALPQTPITLTANQMLYDVTFDPITIQSDSNSYFQIDPVYPGNYTLTANRDGFTVVLEALTVEHENRIYDIELPNPLVSGQFYRGTGGSNPRFTVANNGLWVMSRAVSPKPPQVLINVLTHCEISLNDIAADRWIHTPYDQPSTILYANGLIYFYSNGHVTTVRPEGQTVWELVIPDTFQVAMSLTDIAWDGTGFWTTFGRSLQYRGADLDSVETTWEVDAGQLGAIAFRGDDIWVYDNHRDLLLKLDHEGQILHSFRLINYDTSTWVTVYDMDISPFGTLLVREKSVNGFYEFYLHEFE